MLRVYRTPPAEAWLPEELDGKGSDAQRETVSKEPSAVTD